MMQLKKNEKADFLRLADPYIHHPLVISMKQYVQHGSISTYDHCLAVAKFSFLINRRWKLGSREADLVASAILHDFYLYDWHEKSASHRLHGITHAVTAAKLARRVFHINQRQYNAIKSHMWPLNFTKIPTSREGWILCFADKYCAVRESIFYRR